MHRYFTSESQFLAQRSRQLVILNGIQKKKFILTLKFTHVLCIHALERELWALWSSTGLCSKTPAKDLSVVSVDNKRRPSLSHSWEATYRFLHVGQLSGSTLNQKKGSSFSA